MKYRIRNVKLAILALCFFCAFIALGNWQLQRYHVKKNLITASEHAAVNAQVNAEDLANKKDLRFRLISLHGYFDNAHHFLLDNKTFKGKVGYELYTPFYADHLATPILIDRGFIETHGVRTPLPNIPDVKNKVTIDGMINLPPAYVSLGKQEDGAAWPKRVEYINIPSIAALMSSELSPYVVMINPKHSAAYEIEWQIVASSPEKHLGYAVQWFAFALTILIISLSLNILRVDIGVKRSSAGHFE